MQVHLVSWTDASDRVKEEADSPRPPPQQGGDGMAINLTEPAKAGKLRLNELVDVEGFALMANVKPLTIHAYRKLPDRYGIPEPVGWIGNVPIWTRKQVAEWMATRPGQGNRSDLVS